MCYWTLQNINCQILTKSLYTSKIHPFESNYQLFINGREKVAIKTLKNGKAFIDYSQTIDNVYENLEDYNPTKKGEC